MPTFSFSRFAYFDTNIISEVAKDGLFWDKLFSLFEDKDLTLALSTGQISELADARFLHQKLVGLLLSVPSAFIKVADEILKEEIEAHPNFRDKDLLMLPINQMLFQDGEVEKLFDFFSSAPLSSARKQQVILSKEFQTRIPKLKGNFPPSKSGKYTKDQADSFANSIVIQTLHNEHRNFLIKYKNRIEDLHLECFLSIRVHAYVLFYKYYLGNREPKIPNDFGDFGHLPYLPYCKLAIMERDLCSILNQIKRNHKILDDTLIKNIDFLRNMGLS